MEESFTFSPNSNLMALQEPTRTLAQNSPPPKKRHSDTKLNLQSDLSPPTNSFSKLNPTATQESLGILSQHPQPHQETQPNANPNPQINSFSANTNLQINLLFTNTISKFATNSPNNLTQTNSSISHKKSPQDIFYPLPMNLPTWPSLHEANIMSTQKN